jgi:hypothetical protein
MVNLRVDMWSTKQIDCQPDGSDLMQEAEGYYQELKPQRLWSKKGAPGPMYINEATVQDHEENSILAELHENVENRHNVTNEPAKGITALTLQLKKLNKKIHKKNIDQKYKWKLIPQNQGSPLPSSLRTMVSRRHITGVHTITSGQGTNPLTVRNFPLSPETKEDKNISRERQPTWRQKQHYKNSTSLLMRRQKHTQIYLRILTLTPTHLTQLSISRMWTQTLLDCHRATMSCPLLCPC